MRKKLYSLLVIVVLFISSLQFTSCEAISAQKITNTGTMPNMNGGQRMNNKSWGGKFMPGKNQNAPNRGTKNVHINNK